MLSFVMFSSAAGDACSGRIEFHSTDQPRKQLSAKAGSLLWASGTHPITNPIQNAFTFQVFCCFSEQLALEQVLHKAQARMEVWSLPMSVTSFFFFLVPNCIVKASF